MQLRIDVSSVAYAKPLPTFQCYPPTVVIVLVLRAQKSQDMNRVA